MVDLFPVNCSMQKEITRGVKSLVLVMCGYPFLFSSLIVWRKKLGGRGTLWTSIRICSPDVSPKYSSSNIVCFCFMWFSVHCTQFHFKLRTNNTVNNLPQCTNCIFNVFFVNAPFVYIMKMKPQTRGKTFNRSQLLFKMSVTVTVCVVLGCFVESDYWKRFIQSYTHIHTYIHTHCTDNIHPVQQHRGQKCRCISTLYESGMAFSLAKQAGSSLL